jgi:hypothetical protein
VKIGYFVNHFPFADGVSNISQYHCGGAENAAYYIALEMAKGVMIYLFILHLQPPNSPLKNMTL